MRKRYRMNSFIHLNIIYRRKIAFLLSLALPLFLIFIKNNFFQYLNKCLTITSNIIIVMAFLPFNKKLLKKKKRFIYKAGNGVEPVQK